MPAALLLDTKGPEIRLKKFKTGSIQWSRNGENFASIRVEVKISESDSYIYFDYSSKGEPRNYKVKIIRKNSNLGKGIIYYFL